MLAKCFQRIRTEDPGGASFVRIAVANQARVKGSAGSILICLRPGPRERRSFNQDAAGGGEAWAVGGAAATALAIASIEGSSSARRGVSALQWKGRRPSHD